MVVYWRRRNSRTVFPSVKGFLYPSNASARYAVWVGLALVGLFFGFVIMNEILMPVITRHGSEFPLPDIVGMTFDEAEPVLNKDDLMLDVTSEEYHPDKPTGTILSQFPISGTMVKSGRTIKVVTSLGQKSVAIPELRGFSIRQASLILESAGLKIGNVEWTSTDSFPEQVVVFSFPGAGKLIPYGSDVNLMINRGAYQQTVFVPRVIGLSLEDATARLEEMGLKVGKVTRVVNENFLPETVLEQSDEAGSELMPGDEIDLTISSTD